MKQLICTHDNCRNITRLVAHIDAVTCSICNNGREMHPFVAENTDRSSTMGLANVLLYTPPNS